MSRLRRGVKTIRVETTEPVGREQGDENDLGHDNRGLNTRAKGHRTKVKKGCPKHEQGRHETRAHRNGQPRPKVLGEGESQGAQGHGEPDDERQPARDVGRDRMQSAGQEDVLAARFGNALGQGAIAERAQERGDTAEQPGEKNQPR